MHTPDDDQARSIFGTLVVTNTVGLGLASQALRL
jgi:hypothetical protein